MTTSLTGSQVYGVLDYYFSRLIDPTIFNIQAIVLDNRYWSTYDAETVRQTIITDPILSPTRYRSNIFDCDDYVFYLKTKIGLLVAAIPNNRRPHAFGVIVTEEHAFNFGIGEGGDLFVINTQSQERDYLYPQTVEDLHEFLDLTPTNRIKLILI